MKLYYVPHTRAARCRWMLEEIGEPYELVTLDTARNEHKTPEYLRIHPHGAVPALVDGDVTMFESVAICAYLADRFPHKRLAPPPDSPARAPYYQWLFYGASTLEPVTTQIFRDSVGSPPEERSEKRLAEARQQYAEMTAVLDGALDGRPFLLGDELSATDVVIGSHLIIALLLQVPPGRPHVDAYVERLIARPAARRAATH